MGETGLTRESMREEDFAGGPMIKTSPSSAEGVGSIPGQGMNYQNIKRKQKRNKFSKTQRKKRMYMGEGAGSQF